MDSPRLLTDEVQLQPTSHRRECDEVSWYEWRLHRGEHDIGGVDYWACRECQQVLLGQIGLVDSEQHHGLGCQTIEQLRTQLPGYRWHLSPINPRSQSFWGRLQDRYPGEYHDDGWSCQHIETVLRPGVSSTRTFDPVLLRGVRQSYPAAGWLCAFRCE